MEKYLLSLDLDHTLLNRKKRFPFWTLLGLKAIMKNGHYVILNTGRSLHNALPYIKKLRLYNYPVIAYNGGGIFYINRKKKIVRSYLFPLNNHSINALFKRIKPYTRYAVFSDIMAVYYYNRTEVPPQTRQFHLAEAEYEMNKEIDFPLYHAYFCCHKENKKNILSLFNHFAYLTAGDYKAAMKYLKLGMNRDYYSIAYRRYRNEMLTKNASYFLTGILVLIIAVVIVKKVVKKKKGGAE